MEKQTEDTAPPRRRMVMTKGDWERVERSVHRAEAEPDPAQISLLPETEKRSIGARPIPVTDIVPGVVADLLEGAG